MAVKRRKNLEKCIWRGRIMFKREWKGHYLRVYLWEDQEALLQNAGGEDLGDGCIGAHCPVPQRLLDDGRFKPWPMIGEIHLVRDAWTLEVVSHELFHAFMWCMRVLSPGFTEATERMEDEEQITYVFGETLDGLYRRLWEVNPSEKWRRLE